MTAGSGKGTGRERGGVSGFGFKPVGGKEERSAGRLDHPLTSSSSHQNSAIARAYGHFERVQVDVDCQAMSPKNKALATAGDGADPAALWLRSEQAFIIASAGEPRGCDAAQVASRGRCGTLGDGREPPGLEPAFR